MHFSFLEKFGAAVLLCAWVIYGANFLGSTLVQVREPTGTAVAVAEAPTAAAPAAAEPEEPLPVLLAAATPEAGEKVFGKCKACHTIEKGGANKVGPNLWNIVGGPKAHSDGFAYSSTLAAMGKDGGKWTYDSIDAFLANPKGYVAGTKMSFAGLSRAKERADVIAYLRANTENPPPLPAP